MKTKISRIVIPGMLLLSQFLFIPVSKAQIIHSESFDSITFPPTGWTVTGGFNSLWVRRTVGIDPNCTTHSGAGMARFSSFMTFPGNQELMTTPVIDYSGASGSTPTFSLWVYRDGSSTAGDSLTILANTSNTLIGAVRFGAVARSRFFPMPVNELSDGWYNYTFNVPLSFTTDTNYILLNGTAHNGGNIFIDDVSWTEYPVACLTTPIAGGVASNDSLICGGSGSANLSLTGSGLTAGGLTFQWQFGSTAAGPWTDFGNNSYATNSGTISSSTYFRCYVSCTNGGAPADTSTVLLIDVNPNPAPVVTINLGTTINFCTGSAPLVFVANGASTYTWTPNIAINAVGDSAIANPIASISYNVVGKDSIGCSGFASITVNVSNSPVVTATSNNDSICSGDPVMLHAFVQGPPFGINFIWQPGSLFGPDHNVSPTATTTYIVSATSSATGCTGYDSVLVVVNPAPVAGLTYTVNNLTYTFTDISTGVPTSWLWNFGDLTTDNTQNPVHTYANNGTYTVTLTVSNGLCTDTYTTTIVVLSIDQVQFSNGSQILMHPNPASDKTTVMFTYNEPSVQLSVISSLGQSVISKIIYPSSGNVYKYDLDLSVLTSGMYVMQVKTKSEVRFLPLIKQ
ncbi:MAG: PKD domain-containing protein [Bacteroidia bacterium]